MERHIVWDWNGTLFDDSATTYACLLEVLAAHGVPAVDEMHYRTRFRRPIRHYYEEVFCRPIGDDEWLALDAMFHQRYALRLDEVRLTADARAALERVVRAGWTQSILSMWLHDDLVELVGSLGIRDYFSRVEGTVPGDGDPKQVHLRRHITDVGASTDAFRLVGDTVDDALAARSAGIDYVLYGGGLHAPTVLAAHGPVVHTLCEAIG